MKKNALTITTLFLIAALLLCATILKTYSFLALNANVEPRELSFPETNASSYDSIIVNKHGELVVLVKERLDGNWSFAKEGSNKFEQIILPLESKNTCSRTVFHMYETMPDGNIIARKICFGENRSITSLFSYDLETNELFELVTSLPVGSSSVSWNPGQTKAVAYLENGFSSGTLFWVWRGGYEPMDLVVGEGNLAWNLKDDFPNFTGSDSGKTGNVGKAAWSPDGNLIAFFASPDAIGVTGFNRFDVKYQLYLMDSVVLEPYLAEVSVYYPHILRWSPDSSQIAFIGSSGFWKQKGIWLYSLDTKSFSLISKGNFRTIVWREDGNSIVALHCEDVLVCKQVEEYDLTDYLIQ